MILLADEKKIKIIFSSNWKVENLLAHQKLGNSIVKVEKPMEIEIDCRLLRLRLLDY